MIRWRRCFPSIVCLLLLLGWGARPRPLPPGALARVGDSFITAAALEGRGPARLDSLYPVAGARDPLRDAIEEELLVQEALERGLERGDPVIRRRLAQLVLEEEVLAPLAFSSSEEDVRSHYLQRIEDYQGPSGAIPYARCRARVKADLIQSRFNEDYTRLLQQLWAAGHVEILAP